MARSGKASAVESKAGPASQPPAAIEPVSRPPLLHVSVQESLRAYIRDNALKAGDPLPPEAFLAQNLGVGRNSVREAIKALESLGILETRRGIGVFVAAFSFKPLLDNLAYGLQETLRDVEELREIRRVLETGLIQKTVEMISDDDLAELRRLTEAMRRRAERSESFAAEDQQFHQMLFRCQNNRMLSALIDIFWLAFNKASDFANLDNPTPLATWRDHHAIVEAVAAKDVEAARRRLDDHYSGIQKVLAANRRPT
jgi:DNA-binding FadR family transcriptional regulator